MCRMFGFRSVLDSHVHRSLLGAENALALQAEHHPDGWGVAYYLGGAPHLHLVVTTLRCNHSCKYCHASRTDMDRVDTDMSLATAQVFPRAL